MYPEIDESIIEIVNEAVVQDETAVLKLDITTDDIKDKLKKTISDEFDGILSMLQFNQKGDDIFRQWYTDGRLYIHGVVDTKKIKQGIQDIKILSPFFLKQIKEDGKLFFIYDDNKKEDAWKIPKEHITFIHSGITDIDRNYYVGHLHKAIKPYNQLKLLEDAAVIYRITRAPERRVFYIDVGQMNKSKAEAYMGSLIAKFKNKITYDATTGKIDQQKNVMSMTEDFWLPSCITLNTKIPLLDGRELELQEIINEYNSGKELWAYSISPDNEVVPGLISWAGETRKNTEIIKITLDNGEEVESTLDHKFILKDNTIIEAKNLLVGDSLKPLDKKNHKIIKIEYLTEKKDTGTLTIDQDHKFHDYHNFAISSGIFIKNSESAGGSRGTKIDTLPAGQQLGEIGDIVYFNKKLKKSLNVPFSRFDTEEQASMVFGNGNGEMGRDEIRFSKFISKLRSNFTQCFLDLLKKQLIFKNIITLEDWYKYKDDIEFVWNTDSYFAEVKEGEIVKNRIELADALLEYVGKYFSNEYVMKNIFKMTDEDIKEEKKKIEEELKAGEETPEGTNGPPPEEEEPEEEPEPKPKPEPKEKETKEEN
jgi:hypothetical protein